MADQEKPLAEAGTGGLKLCHLGQEVTVPRGARIVSQGEAPEFFYVIQTGRVRVFRETDDRIQTNLTPQDPYKTFDIMIDCMVR